MKSLKEGINRTNRKEKIKRDEEVKIKIEIKSKEIKNLKTENSNLLKKIEDTKKNLENANEQNESLNGKLGEKVKELANIADENSDFSKRVKSLETERVSDMLKIREDAGRIKGLENRISKKSDYIKTLDKNLSELRGKIGKLTKQREDAIIFKNDVIAKLVIAKRKINQEIEARAKIQGELVDVREKMANSFKMEDRTAKTKIEDAKRLQDLELETNFLRDTKQPAKAKVQGSKDIEFEHTIDEAKDLEINKIKMEKQEKSINAQDLPATKFTYSKQITIKDDKEKDSTSNNGSGFYFGYLSERDKGETISPACVECPKSIDCILSKVHKSNDSVKEIKKWHHFR